MRCKECKYAVNKRMYYCDHEDREDLIGKLSEDILPDVTSCYFRFPLSKSEHILNPDLKASSCATTLIQFTEIL